MPLPNWQADLALARTGDRDALGRIFLKVRPYLRRIVSAELSAKLRIKDDSSDFVQEAFAEAQQSLDHFRGVSEAECKAWLRRILLNNLQDTRRAFRTAKRDMWRETPLDEVHGSHSSSDCFATLEPGPEDVALALEREAELVRAIGQLPVRYREIIHLRNQDGLSFDEIGAQIGRSAFAAQKLWTRGVVLLRQYLDVPL